MDEPHDIRVFIGHPVTTRYAVCFSCEWSGTGMVTPDEAHRAAEEHAIRTTRQVYAGNGD